MAMVANGSQIEPCGYELGVDGVDGEVILCLSYDVARRIADANDKEVRCRALYRTDWFDPA